MCMSIVEKTGQGSNEKLDYHATIDIYIDLLFAEASTATTTATSNARRPAARGRDIKRKQFHSP